MRFSTAIITSLAALSQGYVLTAYKNVDDCKAEDDTNYRIYKGGYDGCQSSVASRAQPVRSTPMAAPSGPMLVQVTSGRVLSGTVTAGRRAQILSNANSLNLLATARGKLKLETALSAPYFEDLGRAIRSD
ncbi:hypothetical protein NW760_005351 [Fusarium oxysporum]|nr:hypothetical protein NW769_001496 [Fusarium oxysporum]KAJ4233909.1 hypothetical protein NW760_005351 [Fusarium oxysporum]